MDADDPALAGADARFWQLWEDFPAGPLPADPRERDLNVFCAGATAALISLLGEGPGRDLGDKLVAGAFLRATLLGRMEPDD